MIDLKRRIPPLSAAPRYCNSLLSYLSYKAPNIKKLNCTSKELAIKANLSETVISRYRNGLRTPGVNKDEIKNLANAISAISYEKKINLNYDEVLNCLIDSVNKNDEFNYDNFCKRFKNQY